MSAYAPSSWPVVADKFHDTNIGVFFCFFFSESAVELGSYLGANGRLSGEEHGESANSPAVADAASRFGRRLGFRPQVVVHAFRLRQRSKRSIIHMYMYVRVYIILGTRTRVFLETCTTSTVGTTTYNVSSEHLALR